MGKNIVGTTPEINVVSNFDLEKEIYEARQRCLWFIEGFHLHGLDHKLFSSISTETICEIYNVDISYFRKPNER